MSPVALVTKPQKTNAEVIEVLENWLDRAKRGEIVEIALSGIADTGEIHSFNSSSNDAAALLGAVVYTQYRLLGAMKARNV